MGDVPFPVGNYTNIDQSAIKKPELVKTIIYSECNIKSKILLWQKPIQYSTVYTRVQVEFFGRENGLKKSTSTYIRENMRQTYRITKKCQNSLQQAKLLS